MAELLAPAAEPGTSENATTLTAAASHGQGCGRRWPPRPWRRLSAVTGTTRSLAAMNASPPIRPVVRDGIASSKALVLGARMSQMLGRHARPAHVAKPSQQHVAEQHYAGNHDDDGCDIGDGEARLSDLVPGPHGGQHEHQQRLGK